VPSLHNIALFALLVVAVISLIWEGPTAPPRQDAEPSMAERRSDYYLEDFRITEYGVDGRPAQVLAGRTLTHYPADDTADLEAPELILQRPGAPRWTVSAEHGWLSPGGELIRLLGKVVMMRHAAPGSPPLRIETERLELHTGDETLHSDAPVTITGPAWRVDAVGLESDLKRRQLTLMHDVRSHYEPQADTD